MKKIAKYLRPFFPFILLAVLMLLVQAFCDLNLPNLMANLVNTVLEMDLSMQENVISLGIRMFVVAIAGGLSAITVSFLSTRIAAGIARDLRNAVFQKVETFSSREFDSFSTASLITRCTNDVNQVQQIFIMGIRMICYAPILGIGGIIMALNKAPSMSWIIVLAVVTLLSLMALGMSIVMPKFKLIQELIDKLNRIARETLNGLMVIRAFGTQKNEIKKFDDANNDLTKINLFVNKVMILQMPFIQFIMNSSILLIIWTGSRRISENLMGVGDMMAFIQYTMQIIFSFMFFSWMFAMLPRTAVSAERIAKVLETELSINDSEKPVLNFLESSGAKIEFKNVSFHYEGAQENALNNISFTAESGETTAIIGATGSGKSSIANLILRFYDVSEGNICINGTDLREIPQEELRSVMGYVPQKSILLSGPVSFNLRYGKKDASDSELEESAEISQAEEFIGKFPEKMEFDLAQGASNISGGQKQRLSIARALVRNPKLLIFDDSFSALDFATDAKLRAALAEKKQDVTKIVIAQRVGTIMQAEKIIVLEDGNIAGTGTHDELMKNCPQYREIAESQIEGNYA